MESIEDFEEAIRLDSKRPAFKTALKYSVFLLKQAEINQGQDKGPESRIQEGIVATCPDIQSGESSSNPDRSNSGGGGAIIVLESFCPDKNKYSETERESLSLEKNRGGLHGGKTEDVRSDIGQSSDN